MPLTWDDKLSVGIPEIDQQHQRLMNMMNELHVAMKEGRSQDLQMKIVEELSTYATEHFATEERWFEAHQFPGAEDHLQRHQEFIERVTDFKESLEVGKLGLGIEISLFVSDWLLKHVSEEDQEYGHYFCEQGVIHN